MSVSEEHGEGIRANYSYIPVIVSNYLELDLHQHSITTTVLIKRRVFVR